MSIYFTLLSSSATEPAPPETLSSPPSPRPKMKIESSHRDAFVHPGCLVPNGAGCGEGGGWPLPSAYLHAQVTSNLLFGYVVYIESDSFGILEASSPKDPWLQLFPKRNQKTKNQNHFPFEVPESTVSP